MGACSSASDDQAQANHERAAATSAAPAAPAAAATAASAATTSAPAAGNLAGTASDQTLSPLYAAPPNKPADANSSPPATPPVTPAGDPLRTAPIISVPRFKSPHRNLPHHGPKMNHKSLAYQRPEDLVAAIWAQSLGRQGGVHDVISCGIPTAPNMANLIHTTRALKLMVAEPCPEINVLLAVSGKLMGFQTSVASMWGGLTDGKQWVFSAVGFPPGFHPWEESACPWDLLVLYPALTVVEDMSKDARTSHLPTTRAGIRTYLSSPVIASDGHRIGSFCMLDFKAHKMDIGRCRLLTNFAELASRELERYADVQERLKDPDDLVCQVYTTSTQTLKRNLASSYHSCIMIIDVNNNFEVLYINESWVQWSGGVSRDQVIGKHLPDLLDSATTAPICWHQIAGDAVGGARFIVPRMRARNPTSGTPPVVFDISFRCGALEALDNDTLPIALPTFVDMSTKVGGIYFGRLHLQHNSQAATHRPLDATQSASAVTMTVAQTARLVIPELKLGHVLGQGGFATAYVAEWHDTRVVCKVQDHILRNDKHRALAESEILLGQELCHSNVIRTLAHGTIQLQRPIPPRFRRALSTNFLETLADMVSFHVDDFDECDLDVYCSGSDDEDSSQTSSRRQMQYINLNTFHDESGAASEVINFAAEEPTPAAEEPSPAAEEPSPAATAAAPAAAAPNSPLVVFTSVGVRAATATWSDDATMPEPLPPMVTHTPWGLPVLHEDPATAGAASKGSSFEVPRTGAATAATAVAEQHNRPATAVADASSAETCHSATPAATFTCAKGMEAGEQESNSQMHSQPSPRADSSLTSAGDGGGGCVAPSPGSTAVAGSSTGSTNGASYSDPPRLQKAVGGSLPISLPSRKSGDPAPASAYHYPVELRTFLVLEFCDKGCLQDAIDRGWLRERPHSTAAPVAAHVVRTALDVAEGMQYLHSKHIIHGDLSAMNVLLKSNHSDAKLRGATEEEAVADQYGRTFVAKVADFGTSRRLPVAQEYIRTESYGTVTHMPPEMLSGSQMGFACDVWAFGVMLWSMWTGSHPWAGLSHVQIVTVVTENQRTLQWPANTPRQLEQLGKRCLAHVAADRPTFNVVCSELRHALDELAGRQASG